MKRSMRTLLALFLAASVPLMAGCPNQGSGDTPSALDDRDLDPRVRRGATVAIALRERPDETAAILEENRLTLPELEALMAEIAADPELSAAFLNVTSPAP